MKTENHVFIECDSRKTLFSIFCANMIGTTIRLGGYFLFCIIFKEENTDTLSSD